MAKKAIDPLTEVSLRAIVEELSSKKTIPFKEERELWIKLESNLTPVFVFSLLDTIRSHAEQHTQADIPRIVEHYKQHMPGFVETFFFEMYKDLHSDRLRPERKLFDYAATWAERLFTDFLEEERQEELRKTAMADLETEER